MNLRVTALLLTILCAPFSRAVADCAHCVGDPPICESPDMWPGSCKCTLSGHILTPDGDIVATVCKESGGGCFTGWLCGTFGDGWNPQPTLVVPDDTVKRAVTADLFSQVALEDGYAMQAGGRAVLRVTVGKITLLSVLEADGAVRDFATMPGAGWLAMAPSASCPLPTAAGGSWEHRLYLRCAYGVALPEMVRGERRPRFLR
jgi:hypothetical protein